MDSLDKVRRRQEARRTGEKAENKAKNTKSPGTLPSSVKTGYPSASQRTGYSSPSRSGYTTPGRTGYPSAQQRSAYSTSARTGVSAGNRGTANVSASDARRADAKRAAAAAKTRRKRKRRRVIGNIFKILLLLFIAFIVFCGVWVAMNIDFSFGDDLSTLNLNLSSTVYYIDDDGEAKKFEQFVAAENRIWVSIDKVPEDMLNAFVAIEDQRFYKHRGVDVKRTAGAVLNYVLRGDSTYGGSTITQQLVKNITNDNEHTTSRKVREMLRSIVLESKISKEQILEMYLNTIYLGQGANGVEAAANVYFAKDVSKLTLAECACIAGITQYPTDYDPILHPENNEKKRKIVLDKMLELGYIDKQQHDEAVAEKLNFKNGSASETRVQSYFLDNLFEVLLDDLMEKGYSEQFATNMIYNGGLKIYSTVDPEIQKTMEDVFTNDASFPNISGSQKPQCAMIVSDPETGEVKGIVGGRGKKTGNRVLNRATQTTRQPGSSIKPIGVYAPALDLGIITPATLVDDSELEIGTWKPKNYDGKFRGYVSVRSAVAHSYNIPAVRILEEVTVEKSFRYLHSKLHMDTLVSEKVKNGKKYSDKNLSSLALGGLTDGVTVMDMNAAYGALANGGEYVEPTVYTKVYDADGRVLLEKEPIRERAFSKETAYLTDLLLEGVVQNGTGVGAQISNMDTCGKTGTTDDDKDRWFIGYTPYYVGSVWFGYDTPTKISYWGTNPALSVWKNVMTKIHQPLAPKHFVQPEGVEKITVCTNTGHKPSSVCRRVTDYVNTEFASVTCSGKHEYLGTPPKGGHKYSGSGYSSTHSSGSSDSGTSGNSNTTHSGSGSGGEGTQIPSESGGTNSGASSGSTDTKPQSGTNDIPNLILP